MKYRMKIILKNYIVISLNQIIGGQITLIVLVVVVEQLFGIRM